MRKNYNSFARQCLKKRPTKATLVKVMGQVLRREVAGNSSDDFNSITRLKSKDSVRDFKTVIRSIVNDVHGCPGHNISCDLHMEHINKVVKVVLEGLGANKSEKSIKRVAKTIGVHSETTESFDSEVGLVAPSGRHSDKAVLMDLNIIIQQLQECNTFNWQSKTQYASFITQKNVVQTLDEKK